MENAFGEKFGLELPETLNGDHRILVVGSEIDPGSERIIRYLSDVHGVNINAATFQHVDAGDGSELLARVFLIEPSEVGLRTRTRGSSKRRPNLTYEELRSLAVDAGVEDLYDHAVAVFDPLLKKYTTQSSIGFAGMFKGSRKNVLSLIPGESSASEGLLYRLYKHRYAELTRRSVADVENLAPTVHNYWSFEPSGGPDWEGFEGFIRDREEIDRLAGAIRQAEKEPPGGQSTA